MVMQGVVSQAALHNGQQTSVVIFAQAISCSKVHGFFFRSRAFLALSCIRVYRPVCSLPSFLMERASDGTDVPVSPLPASLFPS